MLKRAIEIARGAGEILLSKYGKLTHIENKGDINLVTEADLASEEYIVKELLASYPEHQVMSEEKYGDRKNTDYIWVIDPLDGTNNFAHTHPMFCVSIGLINGKTNESLLGVVYNPYFNECFHAEKGGGAFLNGLSIQVSKTSRMIQSLMGTGFPYCRMDSSITNVNYFNRIIFKCQGVRRSGSAALDLCYIACGRIDGFWEFNLNPWDTAAGVLLCTEAGGKVTGIFQDNWNLYMNEIAVSNTLLHDDLLKELRSVVPM